MLLFLMFLDQEHIGQTEIAPRDSCHPSSLASPPLQSLVPWPNCRFQNPRHGMLLRWLRPPLRSGLQNVSFLRGERKGEAGLPSSWLLRPPSPFLTSHDDRGEKAHAKLIIFRRIQQSQCNLEIMSNASLRAPVPNSKLRHPPLLVSLGDVMCELLM